MIQSLAAAAVALILLLASVEALAATRTYTRGSLSTMSPDHLAANIDAALSRTGTVVGIDQFTVTVSHPNLVAGDDATINAQISAYVYDPAWLSTATVTAQRTAAVTSLTGGHDPADKLARCIASALIDELNILRAAVWHPVTSITRSGTTATVTTTSAHGLSASQSVVIYGADASAYNGTITVATVPTSTTWTYTGVSGNPATPATGTILYALAAIPNTPARTMAQAKSAIQTCIEGGTQD
jgi:hypothetical protein